MLLLPRSVSTRIVVGVSTRCLPKRFYTNPSDPFIEVLECCSRGNVKKVTKSLDDIALLKSQTNLPIRDMRIFFQKQDSQVETLPAIQVRPSSGCFLLMMDEIKFLCQKDRCIIFNPKLPLVLSFAKDLSRQISNQDDSYSDIHSFMSIMLDDNSKIKRLELAVLETTLSTVVNKFKRRLNLFKPLLDLLLHRTSSNPTAGMLRRVLAFRKSLNNFESNVASTRIALIDVLRQENDLAGLCLTSQTGPDLEAMELLLEAYDISLKEMEQEIKAMKEQIEDTNDFINIHLNSIRNNIIRMALFMEMGTVSAGIGALFAGMFGMNLTHGLESDPNAFAVVVGGILLVSSTTFGVFANKYSSVRSDYSDAKSLQAFKQFFNHVQDIEDAVLRDATNAHIDRDKFKKILEPVIGGNLKSKNEEIDKMFQALDHNKDGVINKSELTLGGNSLKIQR